MILATVSTTAVASSVTTLDCGKVLPILDIAKFVLTAIQWVAPILLILWGTLDLVKSVIAGKEDDIKKNQGTLIKRIISAVIIFLIPTAVSLLLGLIGSTEWKCCWSQAEPQIVVDEGDITERADDAAECKNE